MGESLKHLEAGKLVSKLPVITPDTGVPLSRCNRSALYLDMWEARSASGFLSRVFSNFEMKAELYLDRGDGRSDESRLDGFSRMSWPGAVI